MNFTNIERMKKENIPDDSIHIKVKGRKTLPQFLEVYA